MNGPKSPRAAAWIERRKAALPRVGGHRGPQRFGERALLDREGDPGDRHRDGSRIEAGKCGDPVVRELRVGRGAGRVRGAILENVTQRALGAGGVLQRRSQVDRHGAEEYGAPHAIGMRADVGLPQFRTVGNSVKVDPLRVECAAHGLEVSHGIGGRVPGEVVPRGQLVAAALDRGQRIHACDRRRGLERLAAKRRGAAGAALVQEHDVAAAAKLAPVAEVEIRAGRCGLSRPAGQVEERRAAAGLERRDHDDLEQRSCAHRDDPSPPARRAFRTAPFPWRPVRGSRSARAQHWMARSIPPARTGRPRRRRRASGVSRRGCEPPYERLVVRRHPMIGRQHESRATGECVHFLEIA